MHFRYRYSRLTHFVHATNKITRNSEFSLQSLSKTDMLCTVVSVFVAIYYLFHSVRRQICTVTFVIWRKMTQQAIFHSKTGGYNPNQDALHQLLRHQQTTIFHLRIGRCRLNSHLKGIGVKTSARCPCREGDQTPGHFVQSCSLYRQTKAADMAHLCVPQNQALRVCIGFVPDIQVYGIHGREDLVNAAITSNAEDVTTS